MVMVVAGGSKKSSWLGIYPDAMTPTYHIIQHPQLKDRVHLLRTNHRKSQTTDFGYHMHNGNGYST